MPASPAAEPAHAPAATGTRITVDFPRPKCRHLFRTRQENTLHKRIGLTLTGDPKEITAKPPKVGPKPAAETGAAGTAAPTARHAPAAAAEAASALAAGGGGDCDAGGGAEDCRRPPRRRRLDRATPPPPHSGRRPSFGKTDAGAREHVCVNRIGAAKVCPHHPAGSAPLHLPHGRDARALLERVRKNGGGKMRCAGAMVVFEWSARGRKSAEKGGPGRAKRWWNSCIEAPLFRSPLFAQKQTSTTVILRSSSRAMNASFSLFP